MLRRPNVELSGKFGRRAENDRLRYGVRCDDARAGPCRFGPDFIFVNGFHDSPPTERLCRSWILLYATAACALRPGSFRMTTVEPCVAIKSLALNSVMVRVTVSREMPTICAISS